MFHVTCCVPALLQVVSAVIQEDRYEVNVTVSFVSAGREGQQICSTEQVGAESLSVFYE